MSLTQLLVPTYTHMLKGLAGWLDKARKQMPEADPLLSERLAPDMYPLSSQVSFACYQAQEATYRLRSMPIPEALAQIAAEGRAAGEKPGSIDDALRRIGDAIAFLDALDAEALDAGAVKQVSLELPNAVIFDMSGEHYARDWALPQFYFHLNTAYAILRHQGIDLGKADYVAHMRAYVRPETVPAV